MEYNELFVHAIILIRLFLPLTILRFPLIGGIACLAFDGIDQTLLQTFTTAPLDRYQSFDKALDMYYLAIEFMYVSRAWKNMFARKVGKFLFFWRLIGFFAFEITQLRWLLLVFPNTFEYFFLYYEAYGLKWNKEKMTKKHVILATSFIWIFIKLPQEYIIHVAQVDTTDWIRVHIFGQTLPPN